jgi:phage portal protein BeeE
LEGAAQVFDFLKRAERADSPAPVEKKASATGRVVAWGTAGRVTWSPRDSVSLMKTGFQGNPVGFRAVRLIAEAAAALPVICQDAERRFDQHPLLSLLARPNSGQGRAELLEAIYGFLLLSGNAYVEAVPGEAGPSELHVLRSDRMSLVPGADGWPVAYDYAVGGRVHRGPGGLFYGGGGGGASVRGGRGAKPDLPYQVVPSDG